MSLPVIVVVMGPAGAGKTTVGRALAAALGRRFFDADDLHSPANVARMQRGEALTDVDRAPWLAAIRDIIVLQLVEARHGGGRGNRGGPGGRDHGAVVACSALKKSYRNALVPADAPHGAVRFAYLRVDPAVLRARLEARRDHFAPPALLASQLATLEEPDGSENAVVVDGTQSPEVVVAELTRALFAGAADPAGRSSPPRS